MKTLDCGYLDLETRNLQYKPDPGYGEVVSPVCWSIPEDCIARHGYWTKLPSKDPNYQERRERGGRITIRLIRWVIRIHNTPRFEYHYQQVTSCPSWDGAPGNAITYMSVTWSNYICFQVRHIDFRLDGQDEIVEVKRCNSVTRERIETRLGKPWFDMNIDKNGYVGDISSLQTGVEVERYLSWTWVLK